MVRVRNDDVLLNIKWPDPLAKFKQMHEMIVSLGVQHVPTIVCRDIQTFPGAVDYVKQETAEGRMFPEIHCWEHVDYGKFTEGQVVQDLRKCIDWFESNLHRTPTTWYTPWGSNAAYLRRAANSLGLKLVDCSDRITPLVIIYSSEEYRRTLDSVEIMTHWWHDERELETALRYLQ
jgi:peptidoglycan/xylan/chitin deacetylase (PgdA/CDA1 family)